MHDRHSPRRARASTRRAASALAILAAAVLLAPGLAAQEGIDETRESVEKWVETRRVISQEKRDWALGKELLQERIELVKREIGSLRERIGEAEENIAEADRKREELIEQNERLTASSEQLVATVGTLESRTSGLLARLPDWIRERVQPLSQRFPEEGAETKLSLGERFQNVVGVLDTINKLNRQITVTSELHTLPNGRTAEVTALYLGVGKGFFVTADGSAAGVGDAADGGWTWTPADDAAEAIAKAVAIHQDEVGPDFVPLPVRID